MIENHPGLMDAVRSRFAHVDTCPFEGPRAFFENAGGALHLKSVAETSALHASYPDNQGRDNPASAALQAIIDRGRADMMLFFNANDGAVMVGESGTEVLFRLIRTAALGAAEGGTMLGSTLEHPATTSAMARWAKITRRPHVQVVHDDATGCVGVDAYRELLTPDIRVATIIHTSPVTGMRTDVPAIAAAIREVSPDAFIIIDGIQHASHGAIDVNACMADGYAVSPYKMFSRHGYGVAWASERLTSVTKEQIANGPERNWELGTRDSGSYATFTDVIDYLEWLGSQFTTASGRRERIEAAGRAISAQEEGLAHALLAGIGNHAGLNSIPGIRLVGGNAIEGREGVISFALEGMPSAELVTALRQHGIRAHVRKNDHYSGNVLSPLGLEDCVRVSTGHYNTLEEVGRLLQAMGEISSRGK